MCSYAPLGGLCQSDFGRLNLISNIFFVGSSECRSPSPANLCAMAPKKRFKQEALKDIILEEQKQTNKKAAAAAANAATRSSPFRPWDTESSSRPGNVRTIPANPDNPGTFPGIPESLAALYNHPWAAAYAGDPRLLLSAFLSSTSNPVSMNPLNASSLSLIPRLTPSDSQPEQDEPLALVKPKKAATTVDSPTIDQPDNNTNIRLGSVKIESSEEDHETKSDTSTSSPPSANNKSGKGKQRNYKNMTRERRVEANARERQWVHTITAAYDTLQNAIPVDDSTKTSKMSKLSIIKIATTYIMCLSRQCGFDYSEDKSAPSIEECREKLNELINCETKGVKKHMQWHF